MLNAFSISKHPGKTCTKTANFNAEFRMTPKSLYNKSETGHKACGVFGWEKLVIFDSSANLATVGQRTDEIDDQLRAC